MYIHWRSVTLFRTRKVLNANRLWWHIGLGNDGEKPDACYYCRKPKYSVILPLDAEMYTIIPIWLPGMPQGSAEW